MTELPITLNIAQRLSQELGVKIVSGLIPCNAQLPTEHAICEHYQVSRTAAREAIKMLTAKGLVSARTRKGTTVNQHARWNLLDPDVLGWLQKTRFSYQLLLEFTQMRLAIEPEASAMVAQNHKHTDLRAIEAAFQRMQAAELQRDDPLASDIAFHVCILNATGNRFFQHLAPLVETALYFSIELTNAYKGVHMADVVAHGRVYQAISSGNAADARQAMHDMLEEVVELIQRASTQPLI